MTDETNHQPFKITECFAWIAMEPGKDEGIPAMNVGNTWFPAVMADKTRVESMRPLAEDIAKKGIPVKLVRFHQMEILEQLTAETDSNG